MERDRAVALFRNGLGVAAVVWISAVGAVPAQADLIAFQLGDGRGSTIAQRETFLPITAYGMTTDRAVIDFRNDATTRDLTAGVRQAAFTMVVDLLLVTGNLPPEATGARQATHDFVYTNTITVNGVTRSFSQNAHADFALWSTTSMVMRLDLAAVPLMVVDLGSAGLLDLEIAAQTIAYQGASTGGSIGSTVFATLRERPPVSVPEPGVLTLLALAMMGSLARRSVR